MSGGWPWIALAALGAYHGLNPAMGWLFAVALGLQERRRGAVLGALPPIALGHAAAVAAALLVLGAAGLAAPPDLLRYGCAAVLVLFGLYRLLRRRHPRWVGMRVGFRDLAAWSFLMATAHGAGLMLFPVLLGLSSGHGAHAAHAGMAAPGGLWTGLAAVGLHTLAMFAVMAAVAVVVYERLGVMILKRTWFNLDLLWAGVLIGAGVLTLFV
ncbi:conserved hypothetical protein [Rubrobacter xylanophilus DSM 9941]|uniref:Uncharacterized protein n=1 Tax=Rubrobacter xylanophilus (strain DSM 9941 / JCM 11954 / NBRC 16129 / PRD-1) TaxID=266117 RepID=Q1AZ65_RUBXD|nr:hypothetical protein [Rubrobacter xylanophilus]ABG03313.1 conserved hypothetical protein [Rubrobacter xylanophilus DSM 9941]